MAKGKIKLGLAQPLYRNEEAIKMMLYPIVSKLRTNKIGLNRHKHRMLSAFRHRLVW